MSVSTWQQSTCDLCRSLCCCCLSATSLVTFSLSTVPSLAHHCCPSRAVVVT